MACVSQGAKGNISRFIRFTLTYSEDLVAAKGHPATLLPFGLRSGVYGWRHHSSEAFNPLVQLHAKSIQRDRA